MRQKLHDSPAAKQRAYRQRLVEQSNRATLNTPPSTGASVRAPEGTGIRSRCSTPVRKPSRPVRLTRVIDEIRDLAAGYQDWLDSMPGNQAGTELADRLRETIEQLEEAGDHLELVEPPRGFGR
jgi:hypothetical protein